MAADLTDKTNEMFRKINEQFLKDPFFTAEINNLYSAIYNPQDNVNEPGEKDQIKNDFLYFVLMHSNKAWAQFDQETLYKKVRRQWMRFKKLYSAAEKDRKNMVSLNSSEEAAAQTDDDLLSHATYKEDESVLEKEDPLLELESEEEKSGDTKNLSEEEKKKKEYNHFAAAVHNEIKRQLNLPKNKKLKKGFIALYLSHRRRLQYLSTLPLWDIKRALQKEEADEIIRRIRKCIEEDIDAKRGKSHGAYTKTYQRGTGNAKTNFHPRYKEKEKISPVNAQTETVQRVYYRYAVHNQTQDKIRRIFGELEKSDPYYCFFRDIAKELVLSYNISDRFSEEKTYAELMKGVHHITKAKQTIVSRYNRLIDEVLKKIPRPAGITPEYVNRMKGIDCLHLSTKLPPLPDTFYQPKDYLEERFLRGCGNARFSSVLPLYAVLDSSGILKAGGNSEEDFDASAVNHFALCPVCKNSIEQLKKLMLTQKWNRMETPFKGHIHKPATKIGPIYKQVLGEKIPDTELGLYHYVWMLADGGKRRKAKALWQDDTCYRILKKEKNMQVYHIASYCICGDVSNYTLAFPRWPIVTVGATQPQTDVQNNARSNGVLVADINLCQADRPYLSRSMLYFAYDNDDWVVGAGTPLDKYIQRYQYVPLGEDEAREQKGARIWYLPKEKFKELLEKQRPRLLKGEKFTCEPVALKEYFVPLGAEKTVKLSEIAGIGLLPTADCGQTPLSYRGREHSYIECPFLGKLPFGWYLDIIHHTAITLECLKNYIHAHNN